jgi:hypothetical protein
VAVVDNLCCSAGNLLRYFAWSVGTDCNI